MDAKGRRVREVWVEWAKAQPDPNPSWLIPYDDLPEDEKDVDRQIGSALYGDGFMDGATFGLSQAVKVMDHAKLLAHGHVGR